VEADAARYRALVARDPRFDGVFFVGVQTTGIYCRPICPARTPARARCAFFATPVEAEAAGFRACFRCRPELAPGSSPPEVGTGADRRSRAASVDAIDALVHAATARIAEGGLNERSLDDLAGELGVTARHVRRALAARLGVSPVELAQSRRVALAKQLLHDTSLPLAQVAFASGFASVRRFNAAFSARMGCAPSTLRAHRRTREAPIELRLDYREPYDWPCLLAFLRGRAIPGVELVGDDDYRRIVHVDGVTGEIAVRPVRGRPALALALAPQLLPVLMPLVARVRRMFDLDAHPDAIARALRADRALGPLVAARPGLRLPGAIDPFEASIRALLGQQVSVAAAKTLAGRFAARFGERVGQGELALRFPTPAEVAAAGADRIVKVGLPAARARAIHGFAAAVASRAVRLDGPLSAHELDAFVARLVELPGIGPWTAHYLAMRALHVPDAFPAADLGVQKALRRSGARAAEARAEAWRPFRSYAVMHLWTQLSERTTR
jgi:AraC family transcriptional regulator of adaptative response / DNA-3-methyladenine glycosylase II